MSNEQYFETLDGGATWSKPRKSLPALSRFRNSITAYHDRESDQILYLAITKDRNSLVLLTEKAPAM